MNLPVCSSCSWNARKRLSVEPLFHHAYNFSHASSENFILGGIILQTGGFPVAFCGMALGRKKLVREVALLPRAIQRQHNWHIGSEHWNDTKRRHLRHSVYSFSQERSSNTLGVFQSLTWINFQQWNFNFIIVRVRVAAVAYSACFLWQSGAFLTYCNEHNVTEVKVIA